MSAMRGDTTSVSPPPAMPGTQYAMLLPEPVRATQRTSAPASVAWQHTLHDAGFAGIAWPREYGGRGATPVEQTLFNEEMVRARAPAPANILGLIMGGPVVMAHGTEAQKQRFLSPILSGDEVWCQGFSEPDAGSDLAAARTRGERGQGGWKVTGQRVWTSVAHR